MTAKFVRFMLTVALGLISGIPWSHAATTHVKWQTYRSSDYGFKIDYPSNMPFHSDRPLSAETAMLPICRYTVACFLVGGDVLNKTSLSAAGIAVNILREKKTEADCYTIEDDPHPAKTRIIHGIVFHYGESSDAGAMQSQGITAYRVFYTHVCFEVALATTGSDLDPRDLEDMGLKPIDHRTMRRISNEMNRMLRSFAFVGPVKDGADWNVYSDSGCGEVFEYPSAAKIEEKIRFSSASYNSFGVTCEEAFTYQGHEYTLVVKSFLRSKEALQGWLSYSGLSPLEGMTVVAEGPGFTEYRNPIYIYISYYNEVFILTVSDENHKVISSEGDQVFSHFLESFRVR